MVGLANQVQASFLLHGPDMDCQLLHDCAREFLEKANGCDMEDSWRMLAVGMQLNKIGHSGRMYCRWMGNIESDGIHTIIKCSQFTWHIRDVISHMLSHINANGISFKSGHSMHLT